MSTSTLVLGVLLGAVAAAGASPQAGAPVLARATASAAPAPVPIRAVDRTAIEEKWGIAIQSLRLTAGGYMLDFRYEVLDAGKAAPLFLRRLHPTLKDELTGAVLTVPVPAKIGALRSSNDPKEGRTYFMFFANPGHFIAKHRRVTITIGDFSVSGLSVQ